MRLLVMNRLAAFFCYGLLIAFSQLSLSRAMATEQMPRAWVDGVTGYAIGGFDPVDYFIMGKAQPPQKAQELFWGGVNWRFRNDGNRQAFTMHPQVYVPRFGGLDAVKVAEGQAVVAEPMLFDVYGNRLYLFQNRANLLRWRQGRERLIKAAEAKWPVVADQLGLEASEPRSPQDRKSQRPDVKSETKAAGGMCEPARWSGHVKAASSVPADPSPIK
jgi:hypothetical protein